jgi:hypothetical protein
MSGSWPVWVALVLLVLSHVFMFALGVAAYHCLRWVNMRPVVQKPPVSDAKLVAMADKLARQQAMAEQTAWITANQQINRGGPVQEQVEDSFAPRQK